MGMNENRSLADEPAVSKMSGMAIASLVCGFLGFVTVGIGGIFAIVLGRRALVEIKESGGETNGRGLAIAGLVMGYFIVVFLVGSSIAAVYSVKQTARRAKLQQVKADLRSLEIGLSMYKHAAGHYPSTEQGLKALVEKPVSEPLPKSWTQIFPREMKDMWGEAYRYQFPSQKDASKPEVMSDGPDGVAGTVDDLSSADTH
jgi:general secretion pathway protein G